MKSVIFVALLKTIHACLLLVNVKPCTISASRELVVRVWFGFVYLVSRIAVFVLNPLPPLPFARVQTPSIFQTILKQFDFQQCWHFMDFSIL